MTKVRGRGLAKVLGNEYSYNKSITHTGREVGPGSTFLLSSNKVSMKSKASVKPDKVTLALSDKVSISSFVKKTKEDADYVYFKIRKMDMEAFCESAGFYRQEFLDLLDKAEKDIHAGRVTKIESLAELINKR